MTTTTTPPRTLPLKTTDALLSWTPPSPPPRLPLVLQTRTRNKANLRLLACHDMAGNYDVDALEEGWWTGQKGSTDIWTFGFRPQCMQMLDVFIYFSHNLVCVPPRGWIECAHRHGTRVYGTLITEWDEGAVNCAKLLANVDVVTTKLTEMAKTYGFDGWFVNIENPVPQDDVSKLLNLVAMLSKKMEPLKVMWYDSVIYTGDLRWQNGLNDYNKAFFNNASEGIFTNYGWREERLKTSVKTADKRNELVWHGIDVWGRGTLGDGGMNCSMALNAIGTHGGRSAAIFAPGWYLENDKAANRDVTKSRKLSDEFWGRIAQSAIFQASGGGGGGGGDIEPLILSEPVHFFTDFCDGGGLSCSVQGKRAYDAPWMDLRRQMVQPRLDALWTGGIAKQIVCEYVETGPVFSGGGCLQFKGVVPPSGDEAVAIPILAVRARVGMAGPNGILKIQIALTRKDTSPITSDLAMYMDLEGKDPTKATRIVLAPTQWTRTAANTLKQVPGDVEVVGTSWRLRTWKLATGVLVGRSLVSVGVMPCSSSESASTVNNVFDMRLGLISLVEENPDLPDATIGKIVDVAVAPYANDSSLLHMKWRCSIHNTSLDCQCWSFVHVMVDDGQLVQTLFGFGGVLSRPLAMLKKSTTMELRVVTHDGLVGYTCDVVVR